MLDEVELKPGGETVLLGVLGVLGELGLVDVTGAAGVVVVGGLAAGVGAAVTAWDVAVSTVAGLRPGSVPSWHSPSHELPEPGWPWRDAAGPPLLLPA